MCLAHTGNRGLSGQIRGLMVDVICPPVGREFAEQIGLFVAVLGLNPTNKLNLARFLREILFMPSPISFDRGFPSLCGPHSPFSFFHRVFQDGARHGHALVLPPP